RLGATIERGVFRRELLVRAIERPVKAAGKREPRDGNEPHRPTPEANALPRRNPTGVHGFPGVPCHLEGLDRPTSSVTFSSTRSLGELVRRVGLNFDERK